MKKLFMILLCVLMIVAVPTVAFAEGESTEPVEKPTITEMIVDYASENAEEILLFCASIASMAYVKFVKKNLMGGIGTLNNNAIAMATNSDTVAKESLERVEVLAKKVEEYHEKFETLLNEIRKSEEEKKSLEDALGHVETFLNTAKLAILELSNEVAELLVLANIPNPKKEELYARHKQAIRIIEEVEGVINNDRA